MISIQPKLLAIKWVCKIFSCFRKCNLLMKPLMGKEFLRKMHWLGKIADIKWVGRIWRQKNLANFSTWNAICWIFIRNSPYPCEVFKVGQYLWQAIKQWTENNGIQPTIYNCSSNDVHFASWHKLLMVRARVFSSLSNSKNYKVSKMSIYTTSSSISIEFYQA